MGKVGRRPYLSALSCLRLPSIQVICQGCVTSAAIWMGKDRISHSAQNTKHRRRPTQEAGELAVLSRWSLSLLLKPARWPRGAISALEGRRLAPSTCGYIIDSKWVYLRKPVNSLGVLLSSAMNVTPLKTYLHCGYFFITNWKEESFFNVLNNNLRDRDVNNSRNILILVCNSSFCNTSGLFLRGLPWDIPLFHHTLRWLHDWYLHESRTVNRCWYSCVIYFVSFISFKVLLFYFMPTYIESFVKEREVEFFLHPNDWYTQKFNQFKHKHVRKLCTSRWIDGPSW